MTYKNTFQRVLEARQARALAYARAITREVRVRERRALRELADERLVNVA